MSEKFGYIIFSLLFILFSILYIMDDSLYDMYNKSEYSQNTYYVDSENGHTDNDGTEAKPLKSLQSLIERRKLKSGDTVYLSSGYYGKLYIKGRKNSSHITIAAKVGHQPRFKSIRILSSRNWILRGFAVSPSFAKSYSGDVLIITDKRSENIVFEDFEIFSVPDISSWTKKDWNEKAVNGFEVAGKNITVRNSIVRNTNIGISSDADNSLIEKNMVVNFSEDAMRGHGDYSVYQYNTLKNCYSVNGAHHDGFQSWSEGPRGTPGKGQVIGGVLRGNRIINFEDPNQRFRCALQAIGMFDGTYVGWRVENNVIITDHWHGITLMGAKDTTIINNTVFDPDYNDAGPAEIRLLPHKDGTPPKNCFVINNIAHKYILAESGIISLGNIRLTSPEKFFLDPKKYNLRLKPHSPAIDISRSYKLPANQTGTSFPSFPKSDIMGNPRPRGKGIDAGAYEYSPLEKANIKL